VPRVCRLQANFVFFFQGSASEVEIVVEEFAPPEYTKNEMRAMVTESTYKKFSFLTINMKLGWDKRFRRNLDEFIHLERMGEEESSSDDDSDDSDSSDDEDKKYASSDEEEHDQLVVDSVEETQLQTTVGKYGANE